MPNHVKSQSTSRRIMPFMPPFMHFFLPFFFISPPESSDSFSEKTCCVRVCGMRSGGVFFHYYGLRVVWSLGLSAFWPSYVCAFTFLPYGSGLSRILGFRFALVLAWLVPPPLPPLREAAVVAALWFSLCNPLCLRCMYIVYSLLPFSLHGHLLFFFSSISRLFAAPFHLLTHANLPSSTSCITSTAFFASPHRILPLYLAFDDIFGYVSSPDRCFPSSLSFSFSLIPLFLSCVFVHLNPHSCHNTYLYLTGSVTKRLIVYISPFGFSHEAEKPTKVVKDE